MVTSDQRAVLVFNGELYNDLELKHELQSCHVRLETNLDTEVLFLGLCLQRENF